MIKTLDYFQEATHAAGAFRDSTSLQDSSSGSPDNTTFFKPPSCTPTKKVSQSVEGTRHSWLKLAAIKIPRLTYCASIRPRSEMFQVFLCLSKQLSLGTKSAAMRGILGG